MRDMPVGGSTTRPRSPHRGRLYVHGGYLAVQGLDDPTGALLRYDPGRNRWRRLGASPTPTRGPCSSGDRTPPVRRRWRQRLAARCGRSRSTTSSGGAGAAGRPSPVPPRNHTTGVASGGRFYVLAGPRRRELHRRRALRPAQAALGAAAVAADGARRDRIGAARRRADRGVRGRAARTGRHHDRRGRVVRPAQRPLAHRCPICARRATDSAGRRSGGACSPSRADRRRASTSRRRSSTSTCLRARVRATACSRSRTTSPPAASRS